MKATTAAASANDLTATSRIEAAVGPSRDRCGAHVAPRVPPVQAAEASPGAIFGVLDSRSKAASRTVILRDEDAGIRRVATPHNTGSVVSGTA